jgi:hypothetical protein
VGGCGKPASAPRDTGFEIGQARGIGSQWRCGEFQVARRGDPLGAQRPEARGIRRALREDLLKAVQEVADDRPQAAPGAAGAVGNARVDQKHRDAAPSCQVDEVRPELRFDEEDQIRAPVIVEAVDRRRQVDGDELMDHRIRQALRHKLRR